MSEQIKKIEEKITALIEQGQIKMKPRWYFVLKSILKVMLIIVSFLIVLYFSSFIVLVFKEKLALVGDPDSFVAWGRFIFSLPWLIFLFSLGMLVILEILVRKYSFVYQRPIAYTLFALVFLVVLMSFVMHKIDRQSRVPRFGEDKEIIIFTPMHKYYRGDMRRIDPRFKPIIKPENNFKIQKSYRIEIFQ
jgi:glucan phosphoethanolaminetransferase (alkaline phosphatase superfamily)